MKNFGKKLGVLLVGASLLAFSGCKNPPSGTNTWSIQGVTGPKLTYTNGVATIYAVLQNVVVDVGLTMTLPHMPNSTLEVAPDVQTGGLLLQVTISAADVAALAGANLLPATDLPGGRPLPGIAGGTMPSMAIQVPKFDNITFYVGTTIFGLFVPVKFGLNQVIGTYQYYDQSNKLQGNISIVGKDANNQNSGFLLLINYVNAATTMMNQGNLDLNQLF